MAQKTIAQAMLDSLNKFGLQLDNKHIDMALTTIKAVERDFAQYKTKSTLDGNMEYLSNIYSAQSYDHQKDNDNLQPLSAVIKNANNVQNIDGQGEYIKV